MKVVYCGRLGDVAGTREAEVDPPLEARTAFALRDWLGRDDETLRSALSDNSVRIVVNDEIVLADRPVAPGDEIAFLPPVSGG